MTTPELALAVLAALAAGSTVILLVARPSRRVLPAAGPSLEARVVLAWLRHQLPAVVSAVIAGLLAYALLGLAAPALVGAALGLGASSAFARWRAARRAAEIGSALLSAVDLLAQLLPAGHSTRQSLVVLAESGPAPVRPEVARIVARLGEVSLEEALLEAQERLRQPLFTLIAAALTIGNQSGGRLAPLLSELGRAAHQIEAVQGQLRAEQAQGRLGALVIALMPIGLLALLRVVNPQYLAPYTTDGGELLLGALTGVIVVGYAWMVRLLRLPQPDVLTLSTDLLAARGARSSDRSAAGEGHLVSAEVAGTSGTFRRSRAGSWRG